MSHNDKLLPIRTQGNPLTIPRRRIRAIRRSRYTENVGDRFTIIALRATSAPRNYPLGAIVFAPAARSGLQPPGGDFIIYDQRRVVRKPFIFEYFDATRLGGNLRGTYLIIDAPTHILGPGLTPI